MGRRQGHHAEDDHQAVGHDARSSLPGDSDHVLLPRHDVGGNSGGTS